MVGKIIILDYVLINNFLCIFLEFTPSFFRSLFSPFGTLSLSIMLSQECYLVNLVWIIVHWKNISPGGYHVFITLTLWSTTFYLITLNLLLFI
uniref:Uncharacterized protein n=1 Tax=Lepeophtheirus salmonis TaxID=72036 RepID=A0A0K2UEZ1_LEPSM